LLSKATLTHPRKLEVEARLDGSVENLTDEQLFATFRDLVERGGGSDVFAASLEQRVKSGWPEVSLPSRPAWVAFCWPRFSLLSSW
jgi:hypothetical protein